MLCEVPLNKEQQAFAADHHGLVYKFLNENRLPEDEFYDVIIFWLSPSSVSLFQRAQASEILLRHNQLEINAGGFI